MKRLITLLAALTILFTLYSCGKDDDLTRADCVFAAEKYEYDESEWFYRQLSSGDGRALALFSGAENKTMIKSLGRADSSETSIALPDTPEYLYVAESDGKLFLLNAPYNPLLAARVYRIDGGEAVMVGESLIEGAPGRISGFAIDQDGRFYVTSETVVYVFDSGFRLLFSLEADSVLTIRRIDSGVIAVRQNDAGKRVFEKIDPESRAFTDGFTPDIPVGAQVNFSSDGALYYNYNGAVWKLADEGPEKLLDWLNSAIDPSLHIKYEVIDDDMVAAFTSDVYGAGGSAIYLLTRVPEDQIPLRREITIAVGGAYPELRTAAMRFNLESAGYRVKLVNYALYSKENDSVSAADDVLSRELVAGKAPDIIMTVGFSNIDALKRKGAFADLNAILPDDFDRSDWFGSLLREEDGRLYELTTRFMLDTVMGKRENVGDSWTAEEFIDFASGLGEGQYLLKTSLPESFIDLALKCSGGGMIDYENRVCDFDTPVFRKLLELVLSQPDGLFSYKKTLSGDELADYNSDPASALRDDKILLDECKIENISGYLAKVVSFGGDAVCVGYPADEGNGTLILPTLSFAVNADCGDTDGAVEFILFASEMEALSRRGFSARKSIFESECAAEREYHYVFGLNGSVTSWKGEYSGLLNGVRRDITDEDIERIEKLIENASAVPVEFQTLSGIIGQEMAAVRAGTRTVDEAIMIINDRCSTVLSENS